MTARYEGHLTAAGQSHAYPEVAAYTASGVAEWPVNLSPAYDIAPGPLPVDETMPGLFRYRALLPLAPTDQLVSLGEGQTPLLPLKRLAREWGLSRLWLKDESRNPTWSYKDRLAAVAVTKAQAGGADTVVVSTTGNHGAAVAAYAAAAGMRCVALTLTTVPTTMRTLMQVYGAFVVAYERPSDRWSVMSDAVLKRGWIPMSSFANPPAGSNPFGVDGYKTIAYEIFEQLNRVPAVVVVPTAYADGLSGIHRGFNDLRRLGLTTSLPRLVAAEVHGPYAQALAEKNPQQVPAPMPSSVSFSTAVAFATRQGVEALRESDGVAVPIADDEQTMATQRMLAASEGLYMEASSVTALCAVHRLVGQGEIDPDDDIVLLGTSTGLKDVGATAERLPTPPLIEPTLEALDSMMANDERCKESGGSA